MEKGRREGRKQMEGGEKGMEGGRREEGRERLKGRGLPLCHAMGRTSSPVRFN